MKYSDKAPKKLNYKVSRKEYNNIDQSISFLIIFVLQLYHYILTYKCTYTTRHVFCFNWYKQLKSN